MIAALQRPASGLSALVLWLALASTHAAVTPPSGTRPVWKRHVIDNTSRGADGVKLGDLNRDGFPDLVTGWEEGGEVRVYLHPGHARSREPWPRVTVGRVRSPEEAVFADLDGDGQLEVISGTEGRTRTVYVHRFNGATNELLNPERWTTSGFPAAQSNQLWMQALPLELDGQHGTDLVLGAKGAGATVGWLKSPPEARDLGAWQFHPLREAGWIMSLLAHDMDRDGDHDILFTDRKGARAGVFWLENPGAGSHRWPARWNEHVIGAAGREAMFADIADVNGDGLADVVAAVKPVGIVIFFREPRGGWREETIDLRAEDLGGAKAAKAADLNGDGRIDLIYTCEGAAGARTGLVWLAQQADGSWRRHPLGGPDGTKFDLTQVLDLDGDRDLDVITCEEADSLGVVWYENPHRGPRAKGVEEND